jgi:amphi-Trp domain-containing protein
VTGAAVHWCLFIPQNGAIDRLLVKSVAFQCACGLAMLELQSHPTFGEMTVMSKDDRDIEKDYPLPDFIAKLRRLADALEKGEKFEIQIAGERIYVPVRAQYNIEHEREDGEEEIEFQIKWKAE